MTTRTPVLDELREANAPRAAYAERLVAQVREDAPVWLRRTEVYCYVVRGIVAERDVEYRVLVEEFGEPEGADKARAKELYS